MGVLPTFLSSHSPFSKWLRGGDTDHLVFLAGLSGVWEREEAGLEKGEEVGPGLFRI